MYSKAVSMWFDRERGIALGLATSGSAIGTIVIPLWTQYLMAHYGWRGAYFGLGITNFVVAFTMVAIFLREPPGYRLNRPHAVVEPGTQVPPGVGIGDALRSWRYWALTLTFTLGAIAINGTLAHIVALLGDRGWNPGAAVGALSASGFAVIAGRLICGWLLDRSTRPALPSLLLLFPALGCALLASKLAGSVPIIGVMLLGFGVGAEIDMMGFFVSRYFGLRCFGLILGTSFAGFAVGVGIGPVLMGISFDATHSYGTALIANVAILIVATLFLGTLGRYVYTKDRPTAESPLAEAEARA
jgi:predicted MFS family arabinose efflux permease